MLLFPLIVFSEVILRLPNPLRFYAFLTYIGFTFLLGVLYSLVAHPLFRFVGRNDLAQHVFNKIWWYMVAPVAGIKLEIEGEEFLEGWGGSSGKGPCIFVVNHQSELDVLLIARVFYQSF
jgi:1-acyl-sn-glycerol-3-phosphate acyltransferase